MVQVKALCTFFPGLYAGEGVKNLKQTKWKLKHGAGQFTVWLVMSAPYTGERLSIMHSAFLQNPLYKGQQAKVYGIASSKAEAKRLVVSMSDDAAAAGMVGKLKEYMDSRW